MPLLQQVKLLILLLGVFLTQTWPAHLLVWGGGWRIGVPRL